MSATQPQTDREKLIAFLFGKSDEERREAERLIRHYHSKPVEVLTVSQLEDLCLMVSVSRKKRKLMRQIESEPLQGFCFDCGKPLMRDDASQCRTCHENILPRDEMWMHKREVLRNDDTKRTYRQF